MRQSLESSINSTGGGLPPDVYEIVLGSDPEAYLHDFVATRVYPAKNITFASQCKIVQAILECAVASTSRAAGRMIHTPASVHTAYWAMESRVFRALSACSNIKSAVKLQARYYWNSPLFIETEFEQVLVTRLFALAGQPTCSVQAMDETLCDFFLALMSTALDSICTAHSIVTTSLRQWDDLWSAVHSDIGTIFAFVQPVRAECFGVIQAKRWCLMARKVIVAEYLAEPTSAGGAEIDLVQLLQSQDGANPTTAAGLRSLLEATAADPFLRPRFAQVPAV